MSDLDDPDNLTDLRAQRDAQAIASGTDAVLDALDALRSAAASRIDLAALDDEAPPAVLAALSRARTRDEQAPSLAEGAVGSGRLVRGSVQAALLEVEQLRGDFERARASIDADDNLSETGRARRLAEAEGEFTTRAQATLDAASQRVEQFAAARERALVASLAPPADSSPPDRLDALATKLDALALALASARADDASYERFVGDAIRRGDPRAAALLEAGAAQGRDGLLLRRLAIAAKSHASAQARRGAEQWLTRDPVRLVDAAELRWVRELRRQARFVLEAARKSPQEAPIVPSHYEITHDERKPR